MNKFKRIIIPEVYYHTIDMLAEGQCKELFFKLILIANGEELSAATKDMDSTIVPIFISIYGEMLKEHDARRRGGLKTASTFTQTSLEPIAFPKNLIPPGDCKTYLVIERTTGIEHRVTPDMTVRLRYVCLVRDFSLNEIKKMTNTYFQKYPADGKPLAYDEEVVEKAAVWKHLGPETHRFSFPPFHHFLINLLPAADDKVMSSLLLRDFDAVQHGNDIVIYCDRVVYNFISAHNVELEAFIRSCGIGACKFHNNRA